MMAKKKIFYSMILLFAVISISSLSVSPVNTSFQVADEQSEINNNILSIPKSSATTVTEKWRYGFNTQPNKVAISKDGNYITALNGTSATLFSRSSNSTLWAYDPSLAAMRDVAMSYNGKYIVIEDHRYVYLLNNTPGTQKTEMWDYPNSPAGANTYHLDISADGTKIAVGNGTGIQLFDNIFATTKSAVWNWKNTAGLPQIFDIAISGNGKYIIAGGDSGFIYFFNTTDYKGSPMGDFDTTASVEFVAISYDGKYIVMSNTDNEVYFFNTTDNPQGDWMWNVTIDEDITCLDMSEDGSYVVVGSDNPGPAPYGVVTLFDKTFSTNKLPIWNETHIIKSTGGDNFVQSVAISSDGKYIVAGYQIPTVGSRSCLVLFDKSGKIWENFNVSDVLAIDAISVAISGSGNYIAVAEIGAGRSNLHLFYHPVPITSGIIIPGAGDDDDDDDDEEVIPGYEIHLIIGTISITTAILIRKRLKKK